jgi:hypothetical protein
MQWCETDLQNCKRVLQWCEAKLHGNGKFSPLCGQQNPQGGVCFGD